MRWRRHSRLEPRPAVAVATADQSGARLSRRHGRRVRGPPAPACRRGGSPLARKRPLRPRERPPPFWTLYFDQEAPVRVFCSEDADQSDQRLEAGGLRRRSHLLNSDTSVPQTCLSSESAPSIATRTSDRTWWPWQDHLNVPRPGSIGPSRSTSGYSFVTVETGRTATSLQRHRRRQHLDGLSSPTTAHQQGFTFSFHRIRPRY